jgi:hypothetical protein
MKQERSKEREKNRLEMPNVAAMLDELRERCPSLTFKVLGAEDLVTGKRVGKLDESDT